MARVGTACSSRRCIEEVLERLELRADLQRAMAAGELDLHYQPIVRLSDGGVTGVEALLRWRHPERGIVPPDHFVPLAEEIGLIVPIGRWVLREACRQARQMQTLIVTEAPLTVAVNLSVVQLQHSDIVADVSDALAESGLAAGCLTLEITETVMMTDTDTALERLDELKEARRPAGDGRLRHGLLVAELPQPAAGRHRQDGPLVPARRRVPASLGAGQRRRRASARRSISTSSRKASSTSEQWTALRDLGCDLGQGFLFARPMDSHSTLEYLRTAAQSTAAHVS